MDAANFKLIAGDSKNGTAGMLAANVVDKRSFIEQRPIQTGRGGFVSDRAQLLVVHATDQKCSKLGGGGVLDGFADLRDLPASVELRRLHEDVESVVPHLTPSDFFQLPLIVVVQAAEE